MRIPIAILMVLASVPSHLYALDPEKAITQYVHDSWQAGQGLRQNAVRAIAQTPEGYLWLATQAGLVRFDGVTFTLFSPLSEPALKASIVLALAVDPQGTLWAGTDGGGLVAFRQGRFVSYTMADGLSQDFVWSVTAARDGTIWAGTGGGGLSRLRGSDIHRAGLVHQRVTSILEDRTGALWVGTTGGLRRLADGEWHAYTVADGLGSETILALCQDRHGAIWIGTSRGLTRFDRRRFTTYTTRDGLPSNAIRALLEDRDGNLWIGTLDGGLTRQRNGRFEVFSRQDGLTDDSVLALFEDREGSLWIGTRNGLNRLRDSAVTTFTAREGLPTDAVRTVLADRDGSVWVATDGGGLAHLRVDGRIRIYTREDGLVDDRLTWLHQTRDGAIWVAGGENGISRIAGGRVTSWPSPTRLNAISEDDEGLLVSTPRGELFRFADGRFFPDPLAAGYVRQLAYSIYVDKRGRRWLATNEGILHHDGARWHHFTQRDGLADEHVYAIHEDERGVLWVATRGGLSRFANGRFTTYTRDEGLPDEILFHILDDGLGHFWINTSLGIFRVSRAELDEVAAGRRRTVSVVTYGTDDGMKSAEANAHVQPAAARAKDGRLWFVTAKGVARIDPRDLPRNELRPTVLVERLVTDAETLAPAPLLNLPAGTRRVEIHYTALSLLSPERVRFKYKLDGYDDDWIDAEGTRSAAYGRLPPGRYTFRVRASNNDGVWNDEGAELTFSVAPMFHQTIWFYALCGISLVLVAWGIYKLRLRQMRAKFDLVLAERNRLAREFHDTVEAGFVGITLQLDVAAAKVESAPAQALRHLALAREMVMHSIAEARRSVWDLRAYALEQGNLASALERAARDVTGGKLEAEVRVIGTPRPLPAVTETNLLRIGQEAITNAAKHAGASRLLIELAYDAGAVRLRVSDDGCGFVPPEGGSRGGAFGLLGMRERANKLGGTLTVFSRPGAGTEVAADVPLPS
ncbi:MAG TPA: two-component regulator propeller domain-containing protein [Vicinamibacterales bacterium]